MLPPPAPISIISSTGARMGSPLPRTKRLACPTSNSPARLGSPPSMTQILAVVPPMSKAMRSRWPDSPPRYAAATAPPAGPDSMSRTGYATAVAQGMVPPSEVMIIGSAATPSVRRRVARSFK